MRNSHTRLVCSLQSGRPSGRKRRTWAKFGRIQWVIYSPAARRLLEDRASASSYQPTTAPDSTCRTNSLRPLRCGNPLRGLRTPNCSLCRRQETAIATSTAPLNTVSEGIQVTFWMMVMLVWLWLIPGLNVNLSNPGIQRTIYTLYIHPPKFQLNL